MLIPVKLADQWTAIARRLPDDWLEVALRVRPEQDEEASEVARVLGPMGAGRVGEELALTVRRAGGASGPEAAVRLFGYLDDARVWCTLEQVGIERAPSAVRETVAAPSLAEAWDAALAPLPEDWSDLLCRLRIESSALLDRTALLCAPLNPAREGDEVAFTFRAARLAGYGTAASMVRRCFERMDAEGIVGDVEVLRQLSETDRVGTHGPVWLVGDRHL